MDGGRGHNGYNGGYDMAGNPLVNGGTPSIPTPPPAQEPQQHHYGRGSRGGRGRGGYGQPFAHQQHSQSFSPQYTASQWQQQQPFYPQQNGPYNNPYAAQPFVPYVSNGGAYYNQSYSNYPYYAPGPGYQTYMQPQPNQMYGAHPHQHAYQQSQYVAGTPQQPITNGPSSPFSQSHGSGGPPIGNAVSNVPLTPASAHSSQFVPALPAEPVHQQISEAAESLAQYPVHDQPLNGHDITESESSQQPTPSSPLESPSPTAFEHPLPNPAFSFNQMPFYTDPDSKHIFTAQKRYKKRFRPIEGHDVNMQPSQPGQVETPAADASAAATATTVTDSSNATETTIPTDEPKLDASVRSEHQLPDQAAKPIVQSSPATAEPTRPLQSESSQSPPVASTPEVTTGERILDHDKDGQNGISESSNGEITSPVAKSEALPVRPKTWAHLLKKDAAVSNSVPSSQATTNGNEIGQTSAEPSHSTSKALADVLRTYDPAKGKAIFIEPRGLYNARVDCYMISILQALLYCAPFYRFLHQVKTQSAQSLKSSTPLLDALIDFQGNFRVIKSADSPKQLRESLTPEQHRQYGETLHANSVFDAAFRSPAIKNLERGKQQDAEEFLILLLGALSDECVKVIGAAASSSSHTYASNDGADDDWKTVEKNGKPAVTQSSGLPELPNPVSKIFKGKMRSEVRFKSQVTNTDQPFTNLKLHIEDQSIKSITDALHRFNAAENVTIADKTSQGTAPVKYQQTFIHKLPYTLVIHLVRFESSGTSWAKNGKHVDYPLELEIPSAILSKPARIEYADTRKYRLVSVVYHHGSDKDSGHYSIDVRRQDEDSWLRINDTQVTAIDSSDVVGSDKNSSAKAGGERKENSSDGISKNRFAAMSDNNEGGVWQNVGASGSGSKKSSNVANGKTSGTSTPRGTPIKDNKVAYLLFYQKLQRA